MPLVWAHTEYIKLRRSLHDKRVFDMPPQPVQRYLVEQIGSPYTIWRFNNKSKTIPAGKRLRIEVLAPAVVHWSDNEWNTVYDTGTRDTGLGVHVADLPTNKLPPGTTIVFTFYWPDANRWEGVDFAMHVQNSP